MPPEIDETYIGGQIRHQGSKAAKASKTMVIGMAERNVQDSQLENRFPTALRIHQGGCSMPNCAEIPGYKQLPGDGRCRSCTASHLPRWTSRERRAR